MDELHAAFLVLTAIGALLAIALDRTVVGHIDALERHAEAARAFCPFPQIEVSFCGRLQSGDEDEGSRAMRTLTDQELQLLREKIEHYPARAASEAEWDAVRDLQRHGRVEIRSYRMADGCRKDQLFRVTEQGLQAYRIAVATGIK